MPNVRFWCQFVSTNKNTNIQDVINCIVQMSSCPYLWLTWWWRWQWRPWGGCSRRPGSSRPGWLAGSCDSGFWSSPVGPKPPWPGTPPRWTPTHTRIQTGHLFPFRSPVRNKRHECAFSIVEWGYVFVYLDEMNCSAVKLDFVFSVKNKNKACR